VNDFTHAGVRPGPREALPRAPLPPRLKAEDHVLEAAIVAAYDAAVDAGEHALSFAAVERICRTYHAQLVARGGRL
jgi:hypothetical protein